MSDASHELDAIAEALGRRAEQRELDEREPEWEAVAHGKLEVDEAVERRRAAGDVDEAVERAALYFRPFDADETESLVDGLLGRIGEGDGGVGGTQAGAESSSKVAAESQSETESAPEAEVVPLRKPEPESQKPKHDPSASGFWWIPGGLLLAAAAAIAMWWVWPPNEEVRSFGEEGPKVASIEPLPDYVLETDGGLKRLRGETEGGSEEGSRHRYQRDTKFEWILRPKVDEPGEVALRGFAFVDGGSAGLPLPALDQLAQIADSGAIRIAGTIEQLDLEPGRYTIALAVGRPADLPTQAAEVSDAAAQVAWQLRRVEIEIED